jgi:hypothetical protein
MSQPILFRITIIGFSFIAWGMVVAWYFWPPLRGRSRADAMRPLLLLHSFRFVGLSFLVPGVVSPDLPAAWAEPAAYGDVIAAFLALLALAARAGWERPWSGRSTYGGPRTSFMPSIRPIALASRLVSWGPPTSLSLSSCHCCLSRTGLCSACCSRETQLPPHASVDRAVSRYVV